MSRKFKKIDIASMLGKRFGSLVAVSEGPRELRNGRVVGRTIVFACDCGNQKTYLAAYFKYRYPQSCGCRHATLIGAGVRRHGMRDAPIYAVWATMHARCKNPNCGSFSYYGARGIQVCERWNDFENFFSDMGDRPSDGHSIDRIDVNGNYEPSNCRWATWKEQRANQRPRKRP